MCPYYAYNSFSKALSIVSLLLNLKHVTERILKVSQECETHLKLRDYQDIFLQLLHSAPVHGASRQGEVQLQALNMARTGQTQALIAQFTEKGRHQTANPWYM